MLDTGDIVWILSKDSYDILEVNKVFELAFAYFPYNYLVTGFPIIGDITSVAIRSDWNLKTSIEHDLLFDITASKELALQYIKEHYY